MNANLYATDPSPIPDARGNPLKVTGPDGYSLGFECDAMDRWVVATNREGNAVSRNLDISGRERSVTNLNGNTVARTWWDNTRNGCLKEDIDALNNKTAYDWDANGNRISVTDHAGQAADYLYDPVGSLIGIWGPNFDYLAFSHDADGRLTEKWHPNGVNSQYEWNPDGSLTRLANRVAFDDGHTISVHEYDYDARGRRQAATDKAGTLMMPVQNGNPLQIVEENGGIREYAYDPADPGKRLSRRDPMGYETHYEYDAKGNPTDDIRLKAGVVPTVNTRPADGDIVSWVQHAHDANGNRTQTRRLRSTAGAALGSFAGGAGPAVATTYDASGLYPVAVARSGDKTGDGIDDAIDSETLVYDDQGRETRGIDGGWQVVQREYDSVDRVKRATDALGHWRDYSFDANGNLINEALTVANARVDSRVAVYDDADRQVQVIDAAGNATRMEYDPAGSGRVAAQQWGTRRRTPCECNLARITQTNRQVIKAKPVRDYTASAAAFFI